MNTYCFHTYSQVHHESIVLDINAENEDSAWTIFEARYPGYYVDMVTCKCNQKVGQ